ncbi:1253_t:CDS:1, partial [Funneliformis geosporum]
ENANHINRTMNDANNNTLDRITQITMPQETNNLFEDNFFNGTSFTDNKDLNLPAGFASCLFE